MFIFNKKGDFVAVVFEKGGMETSTYSEFYLPFHVFS